MIILGTHVSFNGFLHGFSVCIKKYKKLIAAAKEERFNRVNS